MSLNVVITMAGKGSRFLDAGFTQPKYEIAARGRSLFDWAIASLHNFLSCEVRLVFVCLAENRSVDYVKARCNALGLTGANLVELEQLTDGQATSAYLSRQLWKRDAPLLIYNIDTYVDPAFLRPQDIRPGSDGWIPCVKVPGNHWSFVKPDETDWVVEVAEKNRISDYASIGLYWFAHAWEYVGAYEEFFSDPANLVRGERYIAPLYMHLVRAGRRVSYSSLPPESLHALGTPEELQIFVARQTTD